MHYLGQLPDLPLPHTGGARLRTRRKPQAQIVLCQGCCCGQTGRGLPAVPLDWLKPLWKSERLNKVVQLTVSGCLGPCDLPNVCTLILPDEQVWYGRLTTQEDYAVLVQWARRCREQGRLLPPPGELEHLRFERWPGKDESTDFVPIAQDPGDLVLLTAADTEILTWSAARRQLADNFPSVRALNLDRLRNRQVLDAYLDDVLQESRLILIRVLGGLAYWRNLVEPAHLLARAHSIPLLCLPGDAEPDVDLAALCTVPLPVVDTALRYCTQGGVDNAAALLRYLSDTFLGTSFGYALPAPLPEAGLYHPGGTEGRRVNREDRKPLAGAAGYGGRVAIAFYRAHWVTGNLAPVDALIRAFEARGVDAIGVFGSTLGAVLNPELLPADIDALVTTTSFSLGREHILPAVPVLQAIFSSSSENAWAANVAGLTPRDVAMHVALPEFDGRIITTAVSFKNTLDYDPDLQTDVIRYQARADRIDHVADLAANWAKLRHRANRDKKIAIMLANYPSKNARVGNAVGLDTPASLYELLCALRSAGYDTGDALPANGQELIEQLVAASTQDAEFATTRCFRHSVGRVERAQYERWLEVCAEPARQGIRKRWGDAGQSPYYFEDGFAIPGLLFGNIFVGIQPARGYDQDPSAVYHSPDLEPPPYYLAFYRWLREVFEAHAVIHLGKHGNLEWLPGKSLALSAGCYPEVLLTDLPHIYPYIINNPGEGTQAKRRAAAVIVDHLIPPMTRAGNHGGLRQLEHLLDEYYAVQTLDPAKRPLILERIGELVADSALHRDLECDPTALNETALNRLDGYLCEIKEAQIRDGLHVLGRLPEGDQLVNLICALVSQDNGAIPSLERALAQDVGLDYAALQADPSAICNLQFAICNLQFSTCRTNGDALPLIRDLGRMLVRDCLDTGVELALASFRENCKLQTANCKLQIEKTLRYVVEVLLPRLRLCQQEIDNILLALSGGFVPPGPSGAPTRGRADVLPTGRNFYSRDIRAIPTPTAWRVGCAAGKALLERHRERTGNYPESIAMVVWGTSNMRTGGDDVAEILYLLGVRPCWDDGNNRVVGLEAISLIELDRPRIDVTVRISGLFRDAFPNLVRLLNDAVALAAGLAEPLDRNFLRAHVARDTARLSLGDQPLAIAEAARRAGLRIFGSKPGAYGAGLLPVIDGRNWSTVDDLARVYLTWSSYAYTAAGAEGIEGRPEEDAFRLRLGQTEVVAQNQDNREHDIFDSDDYFQFHGGLIAAVRAIAGRAPEAYLGDTSRPEDVRARTLREEAYRVFRSRVVNPRWLAGMMRHGYKGAVEMAATVDYLFGYDATAEVMDDWMYERLAAAYLFDETVRDFLRRHNPWAERAMIERLLEAAERGMWEEPEPGTLEQLKQAFGENEWGLESLSEIPARTVSERPEGMRDDG